VGADSTHIEPGIEPVIEPISSSLRSEDTGAGARAKKFDPKAIELPEWISAAEWAEWVEHRREIRHPLTERAAKATIRTLSEIRDDGGDWRRAMTTAMASGWRGIHPEKSTTRGNHNGRKQSRFSADFPEFPEF